MVRKITHRNGIADISLRTLEHIILYHESPFVSSGNISMERNKSLQIDIYHTETHKV